MIPFDTFFKFYYYVLLIMPDNVIQEHCPEEE